MKLNKTTGIQAVLFGACMLLQLPSRSQSDYSLSRHDYQVANTNDTGKTLKSLLDELSRIYSVSFAYADKLGEQIKQEQVSFIKQNVEADLLTLLKNTGLVYKKISDKQYAIVEGNSKKHLHEEDKAPVVVMKSKSPIKGVVTGNNNLPLAGATISIKGKNKYAMTNDKGEFEINAGEGEVLVFNYIGYSSKEIKVENGRSYTIALTENPQSLGEVVLIGTRSNVRRTNIEQPVPVDAFSAKDAQKTGQTELAQMIHFSAPSFNSTKHGISNVTSYVDPATLRGLGPDQTLVLINGKRRHQSSALNVNNVVGRGTVGTDLNAIPTAAIERIEILRDGAAAQYGSDAIAGIVNLQLKRNSGGGTISGTYGVTKEGDGKVYEQTLNTGFRLGRKGGFLSTTFVFHHNDPTDRSGPFTGAVYTSNKAQDDSIVAARRFNRDMVKYGTSKNTMGVAFYNMELPLGKEWAVYSFGGYSEKHMEAYGFFRPPSNKKRAVLEIYPNGYTPVFPATLFDISNSAGFKKNFNSGWNLDITNTYGRNKIDLYADNTVNPSYGSTSPTHFYGGTSIFSQNTTGVNLSKTLTDAGVLRSLTMAFGAEFRLDHYELQMGDTASWKKGPYNANNQDVGSNGREGIGDINAVSRNRNNVGVYADFQSDITDKLLVAVAARFENYSDFGSNMSGKLAARYKVTENIFIRGSVNRGFRAPSIHQLYYSNNSDAQWLTINGVFDSYPIAHLRNDDPRVQQLGVGKLKAETSLDYNAGFTLQIAKKLLITADAYQIDINNRVVISGQLDATSPALAPIFTGSGIAQVQFFSNAIDTRTKGVDFVAAYRDRFNKDNELSLNASLMLNETKVQGAVRTPETLKSYGNDMLDRIMVGLIEVAQPRNKIILSASHRYKKIEGLIRTTRFGEVTARQSDPTQDQTFSAKWVTDANLTYNFTKQVALTLGANNVFDVYPDKIANPALTSTGQTPYTRFTSQFGFMGAYYYGTLRVNF